MDNPQLLRIQENLKHLKLTRTTQSLENLLQDAGKQELSYSDFLDRLLEEEVSLKQEKQTALNTSLAKLPYVKLWRVLISVFSLRSTSKESGNWLPVCLSNGRRTWCF